MRDGSHDRAVAPAPFSLHASVPVPLLGGLLLRR
jgi:hypothetical protein